MNHPIYSLRDLPCLSGLWLSLSLYDLPSSFDYFIFMLPFCVHHRCLMEVPKLLSLKKRWWQLSSFGCFALYSHCLYSSSAFMYLFFLTFKGRIRTHNKTQKTKSTIARLNHSLTLIDWYAGAVSFFSWLSPSSSIVWALFLVRFYLKCNIYSSLLQRFS